MATDSARQASPVPLVRLSVAGAIVLPLLAGLLLGWLDSVIRPGPGWTTLIGAVLMSVFVAARVIPAGLFWAATMPPITVLVAVTVTVLLDDGPASVAAIVTALGDAVVTVLLATVLGSGLALVRLRTSRQLVRREGRAAAPAAARTAASPRLT